MKKTELLNQLEQIAEAPPGTFKESDQLTAVGWDSLAVLGFQSLLDAEFGMRVEVDQIVACKTVGDLTGLLKGKLTS